MSSGEQFDLKIYDVYRSGRNFSMTSSIRGGGVLIAIQKKIHSVNINVTSLNDGFRNINHIDILGIKCKINAKSDFFIIVGYVPPNCPFKEYVSFVDSIVSLQCLYGSKLLILGDFKIPEFC